MPRPSRDNNAYPDTPSQSSSVFDRLQIFSSPLQHGRLEPTTSHGTISVAPASDISTPAQSTGDRDKAGDAILSNGTSTQNRPANLTCPLCCKRFTRQYNLRSHLRTHNDERPFVCSVCGKAFARQHDRKRHERLHTGKKHFVCRGELKPTGQWGCGRAFSFVDGFAQHLRSDQGRRCIKPLLVQERAEQRLRAETVVGARPTTIGQQRGGSGNPFGAATMLMDLDGDIAESPLDTESGWSTDLVPATLLTQYTSLAPVGWSSSLTTDLFPDMGSVFDLDCGTTDDEHARTRDAGAYTKWWSSYTHISGKMNSKEHDEKHDGGP